MICVGYQLVNAKRENPKLPFYPFKGVLNVLIEGTFAVSQFQMTVPSLIDLEIGQKRCEVCFALTDDEWCERCSKLIPLDEYALRVRRACNYREQDSPLALHGNCTEENYPCGSAKNAAVCHQNYLIYIGRFNDRFKVGITRASRGKSKRVMEQGLNEAVIFGPFQGLPHALEIESQISSTLHLPQRLPKEVKFQSFSAPEDELQPKWDALLLELEEVVDTTDLFFDHVYLYPDFRCGKVTPVEISPGTSLRGHVIWIQGSTLVISEDGQLSGIDARNLVYRNIGGIQL